MCMNKYIRLLECDTGETRKCRNRKDKQIRMKNKEEVEEKGLDRKKQKNVSACVSGCVFEKQKKNL